MLRLLAVRTCFMHIQFNGPKIGVIDKQHIYIYMYIYICMCIGGSCLRVLIRACIIRLKIKLLLVCATGN